MRTLNVATQDSSSQKPATGSSKVQALKPPLADSSSTLAPTPSLLKRPSTGELRQEMTKKTMVEKPHIDDDLSIITPDSDVDDGEECPNETPKIPVLRRWIERYGKPPLEVRKQFCSQCKKIKRFVPMECISCGNEVWPSCMLPEPEFHDGDTEFSQSMDRHIEKCLSLAEDWKSRTLAPNLDALQAALMKCREELQKVGESKIGQQSKSNALIP
jgi:hypothetical protein